MSQKSIYKIHKNMVVLLCNLYRTGVLVKMHKKLGVSRLKLCNLYSVQYAQKIGEQLFDFCAICIEQVFEFYCASCTK